jgi:hypothetical protein
VLFRRNEEEAPPEQRLAGGYTSVATTPAIGTDDGERGPREGLILLLFTILTVAISAYVLIGEENGAKNDPAQKAARGDVKGLDELSLVRGQNLSKILDRIQASDHPLVADIRVAPTRVNVTTLNADGDEKDLAFDVGLGQQTIDTDVSTDRAVPAKEIDASAPERMARGVSEKSGQSLDSLDYVTTTYLTQRHPTWFLALTSGPAKQRQWVAEPDGRDVRHPGELSARDKRANARREAQFKRDQLRIQRISRLRTQCLSKAFTAQAAARCLQRYH